VFHWETPRTLGGYQECVAPSFREIAVLHAVNTKLRHVCDLLLAWLMTGEPEDLIHKAVGWMLREVGKRDVRVLEDFLSEHCRTMPRTMLRYAIERFPEAKRRKYLDGTVRSVRRR